jgi:hypothetical protein
MNLHFVEENYSLYTNGWLDLWNYFESTRNLDGYTWDSANNNLIKRLLFLDNRRMRLDRIAVHSKA